MRNDSISIAKGIGIMLMVIAHAGCPDYLWNYIYIFHMPLFFIMSGYCFKEKYVNNKKEFIAKRVKGLYYPYVKYSLLFLFLHNVFFTINIYNAEYGFRGSTSHLYGWIEIAKQSFTIITSMSGTEQLLGGFWFLKELLFASIFSLFIISYVKKLHWTLLILILYVIICRLYPIIHIPYWGFNDRSLFATLFFVSGYIIHKRQINLNGWQAIIAATIVGAAALFLPMNMEDKEAVKVVPYFFCAIVGTMMVMWLSSKLSETKNWGGNFLIYIGDNTMTILTWHFLSFKIVSFAIICICNLPIQQLAFFPVIPQNPESYSYYTTFWWMYFLVGTGVPIIGSIVHGKYSKGRLM